MKIMASGPITSWEIDDNFVGSYLNMSDVNITCRGVQVVELNEGK